MEDAHSQHFYGITRILSFYNNVQEEENVFGVGYEKIIQQKKGAELDK